MPSWTRRAALVYVAYWGAATTLQALSTGRIALSAENLARGVSVPAAQIVVLGCAAAVQRRTGARHLGSLSSFFVVWFVLMLALVPASLTISVAVFRAVDFTEVAIFSAVAVPALQAWVLVAPPGGLRQWRRISKDVIAHPLARPILWIDVIMLTAGLMLLQNPQIGVARAPIQHHWIGTKLMAAAVFFARPVSDTAGDRWRDRAGLAGLAVALVGVGLNAFTPWILAAATRMPHPVDRQPLPLIWLELYAAIFTIILILVLWCVPAIERASPTAARLAETATKMLFFSTLALVTNGAVSPLPVLPWAPIAVVAASVSATLFAWAGILSGRDQRAH